MKQLTLVLFSLFMACLTSFGQNLASALKSMRNDFHAHENLYVKLNIRVFSSPSEKTAVFEENAEIFRQGTNYRYRLSETEMLMNDHHILLVNKAQRVIRITQRNLDQEKAIEKTMSFNLDSILTLYDEPIYLGQKNGIDEFTVSQAKGPIKEVSFFIDTKTNLIIQMNYQYREGQVANLTFRQYDRDILFDAHEFSLNRYVHEKDNKYVVSEAYKTFTIQ